MPVIRIEPDNKEIKFRGKTTILKATRGAKIEHQHACGGRGKCSTCRVKVVKGLDNCNSRSLRERKIAQHLGFSDEVRLACQTTIHGDVDVKRLVVDEIDVDIARHRAASKRHHRVGREVMGTLVFMDIENFTTLTQLNQAYDVAHLINRYYYIVGKIVGNHGGAVLDYYGDGILSIFEESNKKNHAQEAIDACQTIVKKMPLLSNYSYHFTEQEFKIRIGVHSGPVILGTMGMPGFEKLAAIGDAVNVANEIEESNKHLGTNMLISESTYNLLPESIGFKKDFRISIKGKDNLLRVFELA